MMLKSLFSEMFSQRSYSIPEVDLIICSTIKIIKLNFKKQIKNQINYKINNVTNRPKLIDGNKCYELPLAQ